MVFRVDTDTESRALLSDVLDALHDRYDVPIGPKIQVEYLSLTLIRLTAPTDVLKALAARFG